MDARTITRQLVPYNTPSNHRRPVIIRPGALDAPQDLARVQFTIEHRPSYIAGHCIALDDRDDALWATVTVNDDEIGAQIDEHAGAFSIELSPWTAHHDTDGTLIIEAAELLGITWTTKPAWPEATPDAD